MYQIIAFSIGCGHSRLCCCYVDIIFKGVDLLENEDFQNGDHNAVNPSVLLFDSNTAAAMRNMVEHCYIRKARRRFRNTTFGDFNERIVGIILLLRVLSQYDTSMAPLVVTRAYSNQVDSL